MSKQDYDKPLLTDQQQDEEKNINTTGYAAQPSITAKTMMNDSSDEDIEEENKFNHKQSDGDDEPYYNENSIPAKSLKVIKEIITRHYGLLFTLTVFGASIGFIIYLLWSYDIYVYILGFVGFVVAIIIDAKKFDNKKRTKWLVDYEPTNEEKQLLDKTWSKSDDDEFYIQSDFHTRIRNKYRGSSRAYKKEGNGAIVFEKKVLKRIEEYYGFEIGGGIASFIGFLASLIPSLITISSRPGLITITVLFFTILVGLIGCIIERELRKWNYLPPMNQVIVRRDSIALHDITHIYSATIGYHFRPLEITDIPFFEKAAIFWFKLVAGIFYMIYLIIKYICYLFWINSAFTLWIFITVSLGLLFHVQITKYDDDLETAMWIIIATTILSILCMIFVSPWYRRDVKIGKLTLRQLEIERIDEFNQKKLFGVFIICSIFLLVCSFMIVWVAGSIQDLSTKYFNTNQYSYDVWNTMVCKQERGHAFPFGESNNDNQFVVDNDLTENELNAFNRTQLCGSTNYEFLAISILLLCIMWYLLLFVSYFWHDIDKWQVEFTMEGKKHPRKWTQFSYVYIYRKSHTYSKFFSQSYAIELTAQDAKELQHYLNKNVPWYQTPKYVGIHPYSLEFVKQFEE